MLDVEYVSDFTSKIKIYCKETGSLYLDVRILLLDTLVTLPN